MHSLNQWAFVIWLSVNLQGSSGSWKTHTHESNGDVMKSTDLHPGEHQGRVSLCHFPSLLGQIQFWVGCLSYGRKSQRLSYGSASHRDSFQRICVLVASAAVGRFPTVFLPAESSLRGHENHPVQVCGSNLKEWSDYLRIRLDQWWTNHQLSIKLFRCAP